jgi:sarcosine oxidase
MVDSMSYDLAVVGGGPVGLATALAAADRGLSVVVLEHRDFFGGHGSSSGSERQWRHQYVEPDIAALTVVAREAWRGLESRARRALVHETGSLWFGDPQLSNSEGQIDAAAAVLDQLSLPYDRLDATDLAKRFGFVGLPAEHRAIHQPNGGVIDVNGTRHTLVMLATAAGCTLRAGERVLGLDLHANGATLRTGSGEVRARHVVVAAGAWSDELLRPIGLPLELSTFELTKTYFRRTTARDFPTWFYFRPSTPEDPYLYYGFGNAPWAADDLVQVSGYTETEAADDGSPHPDGPAQVAAWVREHVPDLEPTVVGTGTCTAVLPADPDRQFYLGSAAGLVPHGENLVVCAAGWAFKFVPLFGTACVELALDGHSDHALERFALSPAVTADVHAA